MQFYINTLFPKIVSHVPLKETVKVFTDVSSNDFAAYTIKGQSEVISTTLKQGRIIGGSCGSC